MLFEGTGRLTVKQCHEDIQSYEKESMHFFNSYQVFKTTSDAHVTKCHYLFNKNKTTLQKHKLSPLIILPVKLKSAK